MTLTSDQVLAGCGLVTILGALAGVLLASKDRAQQEEIKRLHDLITARDIILQKEIDAKAESARKDLCTRDKEIDRLSASMAASWSVMDKLKESRNQYWTREEHDKWRIEVKQELKDDIQNMGERLSEKLVEVSEKFGEKIADIIKNCVACRDK